MNRTFSMIKPDAVAAGYTLDILMHLTKAGFKIVNINPIALSRDKVEEFYAEHAARPFFGELVDFIADADVVLLELERDDAVATLRDVMGATHSGQAAEGTIREKFGNKESIMHNAIHGSDSAESAARELELFFGKIFI